MSIFALSMENRKVTIHDIAAALNMSASTVSRALSGNTRISKKTIEKVQQTAKQMGYKPNALAASFRTGKTKTIGVIIPRINRHYFSHAISGMEEITNPAGYNLMICQTNEDVASEKNSIQTLLNNRVDGIIMSISIETKGNDHLMQVINEGVPVVQFDRVSQKLDIDKVVNDNYLGAYEVTRHLIEQGYEHIVHFAGTLFNNVYSDRFEGYKCAMKDSGLVVNEQMVFENVLTRVKGEAITQKLIDSGNLPDAIFSASDYSALGALLVFKRHGILVPDQVGIAGFANEPFTELTSPSITTLEQHSEEMGKGAAKLLIEQIESNDQNRIPRVLTFKPGLIIRDSTRRMK